VIEVADLITYLISPRAANITGSDHRIAEAHVISLPSVHCGTRKSHDRRRVMTNATIRSAVVLPSGTG
jgi:hypothetical protein